MTGSVADHPHHPLDAGRQAHRRADRDVGGVVGAERESPSSPGSPSAPGAARPWRRRCHAWQRLDDRGGAGDLQVLLGDPDAGVLGRRVAARDRAGSRSRSRPSDVESPMCDDGAARRSRRSAGRRRARRRGPLASSCRSRSAVLRPRSGSRSLGQSIRARGRRARSRPAPMPSRPGAAVARRPARPPVRATASDGGDRSATRDAARQRARTPLRRARLPTTSARARRGGSAPRQSATTARPATTLAATCAAARGGSDPVAARRGGQDDDRLVPEVDAVGAHAQPAQGAQPSTAPSRLAGWAAGRHDQRRGQRQQHHPAAVQERRVLAGAPDEHDDRRPAPTMPRPSMIRRAPELTRPVSERLGQTIASAAPMSRPNARVSVP